MKGKLCCTTCNDIIDEDFLCQRVGGSKSTRVPFEINSSATMAFRGIGCGFIAMKEWCGVMNMPYSLSQDAYTSHHNRIHETSFEIVGWHQQLTCSLGYPLTLKYWVTSV